MCSRSRKRNYAAVNCVAGMAQGPLAAAPRYLLGTFPLCFPQEEEPDDVFLRSPFLAHTAPTAARGANAAAGRSGGWAMKRGR